jgi:hypothetical protein
LSVSRPEQLIEWPFLLLLADHCLGFGPQSFEFLQKPSLRVSVASCICQEQCARDEQPVSSIHITAWPEVVRGNEHREAPYLWRLIVS